MNAKNLKFIELTDDLSTNYNMHFIDIAEKLGIHQSNMSSYRSGRINVGVNVLNRTIALHKEITSTKQNVLEEPPEPYNVNMNTTGILIASLKSEVDFHRETVRSLTDAVGKLTKLIK